MAQPRNRLPQQENERIINETLRRARLEFGQQTVLTGGGGGGGGGGGTPVDGAPFIPTLIDIGQTFTIPVNTQALWAVPIQVNGVLDVQGAFIMVN